MKATPKQLEIEARRKRVAALYLDHATQHAIGRQLGVNQATISRDVAAIRAQYLCERQEILDREADELDEMERQAAQEFAETRRREWISERRAIKARRAKLLGLDAPARLAPVNPQGDGPALDQRAVGKRR